MVNKLHGVACKILRRNAKPYTSHTWRHSAATNLADAGVSFINLKRHGQWISDSVVEGYIANSKPLRDERLHCLMPRLENGEENGKKEQGQLGTSNANHDNLEDDELVDVSDPSPRNGTDLTLYGFSQFYDSDMDVALMDGTLDGIPMLNAQPKPHSAVAAQSTLPQTETIAAPSTANSTNTVDSIMAALTNKSATFMNCTFNFGG